MDFGFAGDVFTMLCMGDCRGTGTAVVSLISTAVSVTFPATEGISAGSSHVFPASVAVTMITGRGVLFGASVAPSGIAAGGTVGVPGNDGILARAFGASASASSSVMRGIEPSVTGFCFVRVVAFGAVSASGAPTIGAVGMSEVGASVGSAVALTVSSPTSVGFRVGEGVANLVCRVEASVTVAAVAAGPAIAGSVGGADSGELVWANSPG